MKDAQINLRLTQEDLGALQSVARALGLDMSNTLRFLVYEKQRELTVP
jgi:predicted DNA binding CopG/RHH family protein